jgi:His-Xaa-Ser system protein HxsD
MHRIAPWSDTGVATNASTVVDTSIYGLDALHRTCYAFTDRAYIRLERVDDARVSAVFTPIGTEAMPDDIVAQFENALFDHRVRADLNRETATIRDLIFRQAFVEADL